MGGQPNRLSARTCCSCDPATEAADEVIPMHDIPQAVTERLRAQKDSKEAIALWEKLWDSYQSGGEKAANDFLNDLLETPQEEEDE